MADKKSSKSNDKKVFDIAKPGKPSQEIGSKPMIVGHRSMATDPMMKEETEEAPDESSDSSSEKLSQTSKIKIEPISADMKNDVKTADTDEENVVEDDKSVLGSIEPRSDDKIESEDADSGKTTPVKKDAAEKGSKKDDTSAYDDDSEKNYEQDDSKDGEYGKKEEKALDPVAIAMERDDNLRKIIESKKYKLNIKEASTRSMRSKVFVAIGAVVAIIIALFILIDTNTLDIGVKLPFRIFGEEVKVIEPVLPTPDTPKQQDETTPEEKTETSNEASVAISYPASWGEASTDQNDAEIQSFSVYPNFSVKQHKTVAGAQISTAFQVQSYCEFDGTNWKPVEGEFSPDKCPDDVRKEGESDVYVFEFSALGAYGYKEIIVINDTLVELSEFADSQEDFDDSSGAPEIKADVVERIKSSLQTRLKELIQANSQ